MRSNTWPQVTTCRFKLNPVKQRTCTGMGSLLWRFCKSNCFCPFVIYFCFSENLLTVFCPDVINVILICYVKPTIVRTYKRKISCENFGDKQLQLALNAIKNGTSAKKASADFSVPHTTLRRHRNCKVQSPGSVFWCIPTCFEC